MKQTNIEVIQSLRHKLHQHPERSLEETKTSEYLQHFLEENTSLEIVQMDGWFYAIKHGSDPSAGRIAFRADMDALPIEEGKDLPHASLHAGISHKCGHDGHMAALCGLALELDRIKTARTVYLLFQAAEEIGAGGALLADLLKEEAVSEVYAFHNLSGWTENRILYRHGLTQPASEGLKIQFYGKPSHASAPEDGSNPAEAIAKTILYCSRMCREPHNGMVLCTITGMQAGTGDFGISAGSGSICMTLRAEYEEEMTMLEQNILNYVREQAKEYGLATSHEVSDYFPETRNSSEGIERVLQAAEKLHLQTMELPHPWRASEDFGCCLKVCSGAMFYIGNGEEWPALHTSEYDFNDRILETAVDLFMELAGVSQRLCKPPY